MYYSIDYINILILAIMEALLALVYFFIKRDTFFEHFLQENKDENQLKFYSTILCIITLINIKFLIISQRHSIESLIKSGYEVSIELNRSTNSTDELLKLLMPKFALEMYQKNKESTSISNDAGDVCILFCDIVDFDQIVKDYEENVIRYLDQIFRKFDH